MLRRYVEQILNVFNYIDAILVTNERGIIEYYVNNRPDQNRFCLLYTSVAQRN